MTVEPILTRETVEACTFSRGDDGSLHVTTLMVPWHSPTDVIGWDAEGDEFWYREEFAPGAFDRNADPAVVHRVRLVWGHSNDFGNQLGRAVEIRNEDAGAVGVFRVSKSLAERAREELAGQAVSVSFQPMVPRAFSEHAQELCTRTAVHLIHLGVVDAPAYAGARVLELRAEQDAAVAALRATESAEKAATLARARLARSIELAASWRELSADERDFLAASV